MPRVRIVPGNMHDVEPRPRYENQESVLASRTTVSRKGKLSSRLGLEGEPQVKRTDCHSFCQQGPLVALEPYGILYRKAQPDDAPEIVRSLLAQGKPVERLLYREPATGNPLPYYREIPFYQKQQRTVLRRCSKIDPENVGDYLATGGYRGLRKALLEMKPEQVIDEVKQSGLRGLGRAGFPAGRKWEVCARAHGKEKYVICNGDDGDPGAFQDRSVMEADPHAIIEGPTIAGYAVGARRGFLCASRISPGSETHQDRHHPGKKEGSPDREYSRQRL